jgi:hypothetical protein
MDVWCVCFSVFVLPWEISPMLQSGSKFPNGSKEEEKNL